VTKLRLKTKLLFSYGLQLFFIVAIAIVGYSSLGKVTQTFGHVVSINFPKEKLLAELRMAQKDVVVAVRSLGAADLDKSELDEQETLIEGIPDRFANVLKKFDSMPSTQEEKEILVKVEMNWPPLVDLARKVLELTRKGGKENLALREQLSKQKFDALRKNLRDPVEALRVFQTKETDSWSKQAESIAVSAKWTMLISGLVGIVLGLAFALYFTSYLVTLLSGITASLSQGAEEVSEASRQIATSSDELSGTVSEQAAALQETSAAIEQIRAMVAKTANNATTSANLSEGNQRVVQNGQELVQEMMEAILAINENNIQISQKIEESNREIHEIVTVITEIGNKTQIINDIVFQTKLLSFNASVEAARAGEHGKGFAVVAEEVGNLARMSGSSATEISSLIHGSLGKVESIVTNTKSRVADLVRTSKEKVTRGTDIAQETSKAFQEIVAKTDEMSSLVKEIATASQEQALGVSEVSKAISQLEQVTQRNSANARSSAEESTRLQEQAASLNDVVVQLSEAVEGAA
jgi:methyl-accepting chemotaxis protein